MPARNEDLHGMVPDKAAVALLLLDVINSPSSTNGEWGGVSKGHALGRLATKQERLGVWAMAADLE